MLIPRQVFAVSKLAARESTRYAINGVMVERKNGKCIASVTDGRRLITVKWDDADDRGDFPADCGDMAPVDDFKAIVSRSQWDEAGKLIPKPLARLKPILGNCLLEEKSANGTLAMVTTDRGGETLEGVHGRRRVSDRSIEGHFPKCSDVIPDYDIGRNAVAIGVNPRLLAETLRAVEDTATDEESKGVRLIIPTDPLRPMVIESDANGVQATAVLMPVKVKAAASGAVDNSPICMAPVLVTLLKNMILSGSYALLRKGHADYGELAEQRECADSIVEMLKTLGETDVLEAAGIVEPAESVGAA